MENWTEGIKKNKTWRRHWLFIVLSVCPSQTPKTRPVIRPAFFLHTAYSWLNTPVLQLHSHTVSSAVVQRFGPKTGEWLRNSTVLPHANKFAEVETWQLDRPKTQQPQPACSVKGPTVWGFGWGGWRADGFQRRGHLGPLEGLSVSVDWRPSLQASRVLFSACVRCWSTTT